MTFRPPQIPTARFARFGLILALLPFAPGVAACAGAAPQVDDATNVDETDASAKESDSLPTRSLSGTGDVPANSKATVKDDDATDKKAAPCGGASIGDLLSVLQQTGCEVPQGKIDEPQKDVKDQLEITVATDSPKVAPGGSAKVTVTYKNKGKTALPLDFAADPEPRFDFEVYSPKGSRIDKPAGDSPPLPTAVANAPEPDKTISRVTLAPQGTAKLTVTWNAVKYKWVSKERAKGAVPGRGYPREPGGPLPKGKYVLRVVTPLVGVSEGIDHELSQPRVPVEIGAL